MWFYRDLRQGRDSNIWKNYTDQIEIVYLNSTKNKNTNYRNYNVFGFPFTL